MRLGGRMFSYYLTLLLAVFSVAMTAAAQSTSAQATPNRVRGKHNGKIVFTSDRHYKGLSIWSMNPDGSSPTRLTDDKGRTEKPQSFSPVYERSPVWSPDGTKIAFISNRNYQFSLYVMNEDGRNVRLVTDKVVELLEPAWSPDGEKIAFSAGITATFGSTKPPVNIYVVNMNGSGLTQLTQDSGVNRSPTWSPDSKQIAFASNRDSESQTKIWVMNADGSNQREINKSFRFGAGEPAWSPDGTKILFTGERACTNDIEIAIYVMNADGSNTRLLTNDPNSCGVYSSPRWSPDGTKIVASFKSRARNDITLPTQIIVMNADGSNPVNISNRRQYYFNTGTSLFADFHGDWQPLGAPLDSASSVVGFSAPSYTVAEGAKSVSVTVTRTGNLKDVASCFYVTLTDGIKVNDPAATGTLRFAPGESSKTISIKFDAWDRSFKIILSDNEGNATFVGGIKEATVTVR